MAHGTTPELYREQLMNICVGIIDQLGVTKDEILVADQEQGNDEDTNTIRGRLSDILYDLKEKNNG